MFSSDLTALQFTIQGAIQRWFGDVLDLKNLDVQSVDSTLTIDIQYVVRRTNQTETAHFTRTV